MSRCPLVYAIINFIWLWQRLGRLHWLRVHVAMNLIVGYLYSIPSAYLLDFAWEISSVASRNIEPAKRPYRNNQKQHSQMGFCHTSLNFRKICIKTFTKSTNSIYCPTYPPTLGFMVSGGLTSGVIGECLRKGGGVGVYSFYLANTAVIRTCGQKGKWPTIVYICEAFKIQLSYK